MGRSYAAWVVGEMGVSEAIPLLLELPQYDESPLARYASTIALSRLGDYTNFSIWIEGVQGGTRITHRAAAEENIPDESLALSYHLSGEHRFSFPLSEQGASVLALAFCDDKTKAVEIDRLLLKKLNSLLAEVEARRFGTKSIQIRRFRPPPSGAAVSNLVNPDESLLEVVIFAMGRRRVTAAFPILLTYFQSLSHYPSYEKNEFLIRVGTPDPLYAKPYYQHVVNTSLLLAVLYELDRHKTVKAVGDKLAEFNFHFEQADYNQWNQIWSCMYLDIHLQFDAARFFSASDSDAIQAIPITPHFTHADFQFRKIRRDSTGKWVNTVD